MLAPKLPIGIKSRMLSALAAAAALSLVTLAPGAAFAQPKPMPLGSFGDWHAFALQQGKTKTCYLVGRPTASAPAGLKRGDPYIMISDTPVQKVDREFSINFGYVLKKGTEPGLSVGTDHFALVVFDKPGYEQTGWAKDSAGDHTIALAMEKGDSLAAKGVSSHGTETTDTYSLNGVSAALKAIGAACK